MRQNNPWAFGLVFLMIFAYLAYNNFELPTIFFGETKIVAGKIINIQVERDTRGTGYVQNIKYVYAVNGNYLLDKKIVGKKYGVQYLGNNVKIEYSVKNPHRNKVLGFRKIFRTTNKETFFAAKKVGYYQIDLINDMFFYTDFADYGKIIDERIGSYSLKDDTLLEVTPYIFNGNNQYIKYLMVSDSLGEKQLVELGSNRVFR